MLGKEVNPCGREDTQAPELDAKNGGSRKGGWAGYPSSMGHKCSIVDMKLPSCSGCMSPQKSSRLIFNE